MDLVTDNIFKGSDKQLGVLFLNTVVELSKIPLAQTLNEAQEVVMEVSELPFMLGSVRFFRTLEERDDLVESATKFYLESRLWDTLEQ